MPRSVLAIVVLAVCGCNALVVTPAVSSVARSSSDVQMFMGGSSSTPKKGAKRVALKTVGAKKPASSPFASNGKRPKASLNIFERGPAGIAEPVKEGKKFFSEENWAYQAFSMLKDLPSKFGVGQMVPGMDEGIRGMRTGGIRKLRIPGNLAFGAKAVPAKVGRPSVPPYTPIEVTVELNFIPGADDVYEAGVDDADAVDK